MNTSARDIATLRSLHIQIDDLCRRFKKVRSEATGIIQNSQMPDATLHLNDVIKSTEQATMTILDAATNISSLIETSDASDDCKREAATYVGRIFEACSFQDISGQQIRRVLDHLSDLEAQLYRLSEISRGEASREKVKDHLLNGPQLSSVAPSQEDVDTLFKEAK